MAIGIARLGSTTDQQIKVGTLTQLSNQEFGSPLHSLIIIGKNLHILETDYLKHYAIDVQSFVDLVNK